MSLGHARRSGRVHLMAPQSRYTDDLGLGHMPVTVFIMLKGKVERTAYPILLVL